MGSSIKTQVAGRELSLSNLNKVFWPQEGYTKSELIQYYVEVAPYIMEHLKDRPLARSYTIRST